MYNSVYRPHQPLISSTRGRNLLTAHTTAPSIVSEKSKGDYMGISRCIKSSPVKHTCRYAQCPHLVLFISVVVIK